MLALPSEDIVIKTLATGGLYGGEIKNISMLGSDETIQWKRSAGSLTIKLPKTLPEGQLVISFRID